MIIKTSTKGVKATKGSLTTISKPRLVKPVASSVIVAQPIATSAKESVSAWVTDFQVRSKARNPRAEWEALWS